MNDKTNAKVAKKVVQLQLELVAHMMEGDKASSREAVEFLFSTIIKKRGEEAEMYLRALCRLAEETIVKNIVLSGALAPKEEQDEKN